MEKKIKYYVITHFLYFPLDYFLILAYLIHFYNEYEQKFFKKISSANVGPILA